MNLLLIWKEEAGIRVFNIAIEGNEKDGNNKYILEAAVKANGYFMDTCDPDVRPSVWMIAESIGLGDFDEYELSEPESGDRDNCSKYVLPCFPLTPQTFSLIAITGEVT